MSIVVVAANNEGAIGFSDGRVISVNDEIITERYSKLLKINKNVACGMIGSTKFWVQVFKIALPIVQSKPDYKIEYVAQTVINTAQDICPIPEPNNSQILFYGIGENNKIQVLYFSAYKKILTPFCPNTDKYMIKSISHYPQTDKIIEDTINQNPNKEYLECISSAMNKISTLDNTINGSVISIPIHITK